MRHIRSFLLALAAMLVTSTAAMAQNAPTTPRVIYAVVFGVLFDEAGEVRQLRLIKVVEPR